MEHEDKSQASLNPPTEVGRPRASSAPVVDDGGGGGGGGAPSGVGAQESPAERPSKSVDHASPPSGAAAREPGKKSERSRKRPKKGPGSHPNNVRRLRIERMMSKAELARRANLSVLTIDRVEKGYGCRMDTKRKILEALGLSLGDRVRVFGEEE